MAFGDDFYKSVELAIQATGAQGVADLERHVLALKQQIAAYQVQLAAGGTLNQRAVDDLAKLSAEFREASEASAATQRVINGLPAKLEQTKSSAQAASRGILELSRGFEDLTTGGFLGVLNNIPGTIRNFGQAAKLSAPQVALLTAAALGTAGYINYQNWDKITGLFKDPLSPKLLDSIKDVEGALKEWTAKEWKTRDDVQDIDIAKGEIDELTRAKEGYDKLNVPTEEQAARG